MFTNVFEFKPRHSGVKRGKWDELSIIERQFSRIADELVIRWKRADIDAYLNGLMLDDRGNRQGFPPEVLDDLMFLSNLRWQMQHPSYNRADQGLVEQFSFNTLPRLDSRYCEPGRTWVLA
ncbi:MAG: hypothetical protein Q8M09_17895 [Pseudomonadota bacterium]|nr:hypothetical protein [Pseudomonadota bacterium]MDP1906091.1 hypothetical protein [Pseudomonadota bacterium]MDP2353167.1 hypothetical protein [Pseudomonadota bacterium]